ncbi:MAG: ABC transporter ATP-binding protein, partial [Planctomycetes bacterium]|nr:ABC transporter ATP-binding protein [Planctomycetota bacterium]
SKHRNLKRLVDLAQPYKGLLFDAVLSMLVLSALNLVSPIPMKILIDNAIPEGNLGLLGAVVIGLLCLNLFRQGVSYLNSYTISYVGSRLVFDMRRKLFQHLQRLSLSFYDSRRSGEIVSRLLSDVYSVQTLITGSALSLLVNVFMFVSILIIVFLMHWKLALVSIAIFPLHILTYFFYNKRVTTSSRRASQKSCEIWGSAQEAIGGAKLVKSFTAEVREGKDFVHETKESFGLNLDLTVLSMQWNRTANILAAVGTLVVLWYGGLLVMRKEMQLGTFLAFNAYVGMLYGPVMQLISMVGQVLPALVGVERVFEILDMIPEVQEAPEPIVLTDMKGEVEFKNVSFSYSEDEEVL